MAKKTSTKASTANTATTKKKASTAKRSTKRAAAAKPRDKCFVMMPFHAPFNAYYEHVYKPAIGKAGLEPTRADDLFRPSVIISDIWDMIQEATVLFAELTSKNANVFYELGLAHALGKPVIFVSETMDDVPFDLQQLRMLLYDKNVPDWGEQLAIAITASIKETLANPVEAVPAIFRTKVEGHGPKQDALEARMDALESQVRAARTEQFASWRRAHATPTGQNPRSLRFDQALAATVELKNARGQLELAEWTQKWSVSLPIAELNGILESSHLLPSDVETVKENLYMIRATRMEQA